MRILLFPKSRIVRFSWSSRKFLTVFDIRTHDCPKKRFRFLQRRAEVKTAGLEKTMTLKFFFWTLLQILFVLNLKQSSTVFGQSGDSNIFFIGFYSLNSFHQCLSRKFITCKRLFFQKSINFIPWLRDLMVRRFWRMLTISVSNYRFDFFPQNFSWKLYILGGKFVSDRNDLKPWFRILIVGIRLQSVFIILKSIQIPNLFFCSTFIGLTSSFKVLTGNLPLEKKNICENLSLLFLRRNHSSGNIPENYQFVLLLFRNY